jgi:hypothetical protein
MAADQQNAAKQARMEEANLAMAEAKVDELKGKITKTNADKVLANLNALLAAVEAAATIATIPGVAPAADALAKSAGFEDQTPADPIVAGEAVAPVQPALPAGGAPMNPEPGSGLPTATPALSA